MNITEADHVSRLLRLLDGSYSGRSTDQIIQSVEYLTPRVEKPLLVSMRLDMDEVRDTVRARLELLSCDDEGGLG